MSADLIQALSNVHPPMSASATLPPACYGTPAVVKTEEQALFRSGWIGIGRHDQWQTSGNYSALEIAGVRFIVLRDGNKALRAYANSCRHRGSALLEGTGCVKAISCPFHRWTYGLDGQLRGAPRMPRDESFDKSQFGLVEFSTAERGGFAFVSFEKNPCDIDAWLGDFCDVHAPWSMDSLVLTRRVEFEVHCNWKGFLEVFNEYYHLPFVHPNSIDSVYAHPEPHDEVTGCYASQFGRTEGTGGLMQSMQAHALPAMETIQKLGIQGARYTWLFPNMTFAASGEALWVYEATPLGADRSRVVQSVCFPRETVAQADFEVKVQPYYDRMDAALGEDLPALERHHQGITSPFAQQGRFCAHLEPNVANFAFWYAKRMKAELERENAGWRSVI